MISILNFAAMRQAQFSACIKDLSGYETMTTFYQDLTIAESYNENAVKDTFERICKEWIGNYEYFTEFVLCLNHKIWEHYKTNEKLAKLYDKLWSKAENLFYKHYENDEAAKDYYFKITD